MKKILLFSAILIVTLSGCNHSIYRSGYEVNKSQYKNCNITIKKHLEFVGDMEFLGEIRLGDGVFTTACSEAAAMELLRNEGCALGADLVNITEEKYPNILSTCYRCTAQFYKHSGGEEISQSVASPIENFDPEHVSKAERKSVAGSIIGYTLGFVLGYTLVSLIMK